MRLRPEGESERSKRNNARLASFIAAELRLEVDSFVEVVVVEK
jgi:hypothetical protein